MSDHESGNVVFGKHSLHFMRMGRGKKLLLAFHGYSNDAGLFTPIAPYLEQDYTFISIDLPFHGSSKWQQEVLLTRKDLQLLIETLKKEFKTDKVSLLGYSLGGRVCLTILELMPESIDKVLLIASDGLVFNYFYYFLTRTSLGNALFRRFASGPQRYVHLIQWLRKHKWLDASRYKFVMRYVHTDESREFLLNVWMSVSEIIPHHGKVKGYIKQYNIPVHIFMGTYDRVIPMKNAEHFAKGVHDDVQLHILEKGHDLFDPETLPQMAECLLY
ncbi:MAG: alpha/beta hydrolase [Bacteroidota bacterium]